MSVIPLIYADNMCHSNTRINRKNAYKHLNLKIVGGGLGLDGWFEFGGKDWKLKDYLKKPTDIHFWLEDEEGNVYDYIQKSWNLVAKIRGVYSKFPNVEIKGMSKAEIKRLYKIEYVPAEEVVYKVCYKKVMGVGVDE